MAKISAKLRDQIRDLMLEVLREQPVDDDEEIYTDSFNFADIGFELMAERVGITNWCSLTNALAKELKAAKQ